MKILLPQGVSMNVRNFLRRQGYSCIMNSYNDRISFIKRLTTSNYPRFHIYVEKDISGNNYINLHLDQKKPSYAAGHAHMGEYDSEIVNLEAKKIIKSLYKNLTFSTSLENKPQEKNFLKKLFHL